MRTRGLGLLLPFTSAFVACGGGPDPSPPDPAPSVRFERALHAFELVEVGDAAEATLALVNEGETTAPVDSIAVITVTRGGFALAGTTCGAALEPGARCDVTVRFEPAALGEHAGSVAVTAGGATPTADVSGSGAWRLTVTPTGDPGSIVSTPAGISCGSACSALFAGDVVLTADAPAGTAVGWSLPGCPDAACTIPAPTGSLAVSATFASSLLSIDLAGSAAGEVQVLTASLVPVATCTTDCNVPLKKGEMYQLVAATPSKSALTGVCSGVVECTFTAAPGKQAATATFDLDAAAKEEWAILLPQPLHTAAFDSAGNLIVGGGDVRKLSPAGATLWTAPIAPVAVATGPGDTIYVHAGSSLVKLSPAGAVLWTSPIPAGAGGCPASEFVHCLGVAPDGAAAIHGTSLIARWTAAGALAWTRPMPNDAHFTMAVDGQGIVHATIESPITFETQDALRFAPDGSSLPPIEDFCDQYHGMIATGFDGVPFCTSSGHSDVYGVGSFPLNDPDYVPTGLADTGIGDMGWVFYLDDNSLPFGLTYRMARYGASGLIWEKHGGLVDLWTFSVGTVPRDIAGSSTGRLALVGAFHGPTGQPRGWVSSFAP